MPIEFQTHVILQVVVWSFITGLIAFVVGRWWGSRSPKPRSRVFAEEVRRWENAIDDFHNLQAKIHHTSDSDTESLAQFLAHEIGLPEEEVLFWSLKIMSEMHRHYQRGEHATYRLNDGRMLQVDHPFPKRISVWPQP